MPVYQVPPACGDEPVLTGVLPVARFTLAEADVPVLAVPGRLLLLGLSALADGRFLDRIDQPRPSQVLAPFSWNVWKNTTFSGTPNPWA